MIMKSNEQQVMNCLICPALNTLNNVVKSATDWLFV